MNKAVIYARYSSLRQNEESIEQQVNECKRFAEEKGYTITAIYADKAISGRTDKRPDFQKMIRHAEQHRFKTVIAYKSNRISRNMLQAMLYEERLNKAGVELVYAKEMFDNNAAGRFALRSLMNLNQFYSENLGEDVKRAMHAKALECKANSFIPYGYKTDKDKNYVIDEDKAAIVREIFERYAAKEPPSSIVDDLNNRGLRTPRGKPYSIQTIMRVITRKTYKGVYKWGDVEIEDGVPAIVSKELWNMCQEQIGKSKRIPSPEWNSKEYLLSGKLFCGHCGAKMVGQASTSHTGKKYYYYTCYSVIKKKSCDKKRIEKNFIESKIIDIIVNQILTDETIEKIVKEAMDIQRDNDVSAKLESAKADLKQVNADIQNFMEIIKRGEWASPMKQELEKLDERRTQLEDTITDLSDMPDEFAEDHIRTYLKSLRALKDTPFFEKQLINIFVNAIYLYDDHFDIYYTHEPNMMDSITLEEVRIGSLRGHHNGLIRTLHVYRVSL